ncbi:MFS transporter [Dermacoccus abyssi]
MFWFAGGLATLLVARALQGLAAGLLIPALSAMMIDFEPPSHPNIAALWNTIGPMIGLGTGALGAALLLDLTPEPTAAVFGLLVLAFLIVAATVWITPELVPKTRLRRGDLRPRFTVPPHLRRMFTAGVPAIIAGWATNGLFLALGAGLVGSELGGSTHTHAGIVIFALAISGVTASSVLQRRSARTISLYATSALAFGTAVSIGALALGSYPAYVASVAIVGSGFGTAFLGVLRTLMPHTASSERAAVMAVIYTVAYLAFGVPTIVAGLLVPVLTLSGTMTILGAIIIALSLAATVLRLRIPQAVAGPAETDDLPEPPTDSHRRSAPDREEQP